MIKAIIFDCFGVLVQSSLEPFYSKFLHNDTKLVDEAEKHMHLANKGLISSDDFIEKLATLAHMPVGTTKEYIDRTPVNEELLVYIRKALKPKYKIGFLSNASGSWLEELFTPEQIKLFDATVLSYDIGFAKPEAEAYEAIAEKLGMRLDECIFIDDRQVYVEGAQAVGMQAVLFKSTEQLERELSGMLDK